MEDRLTARLLAKADIGNRSEERNALRLTPVELPLRYDNPSSGVELLPGLSCYHDAPHAEFATSVLAPGSVRLTLYQFAGSYMSLAVMVPSAVRRAFRPGCLLQIGLEIEATRPLTTFLRLNVQNAQAVEVLHETIVVGRERRNVSFDLGSLRGTDSDVKSTWLDIILSDPEFCEIDLSGVLFEVKDRGAPSF
ncbi:MAG: DUF6478 family protein [Pseudomonadota bacterium]